MRYGHFITTIFCAWVLWSQQDFSSWETTGPKANPTFLQWWDIPAAYETKSECDIVQGRLFSWHLMKKTALKTNPYVGSGEVTSVPNTYVSYLGPGYSTNTNLVCLPDTVDPRAKK